MNKLTQTHHLSFSPPFSRVSQSWRSGKKCYCNTKCDCLLALVLRQSAALSSGTQHVTSPEFGGKWGTKCLNTGFPLPSLLCAGFIVKLIFNREAIVNLALRHSVPNTPSNFRNIACCRVELNTALQAVARARKCKQFIEPSRSRIGIVRQCYNTPYYMLIIRVSQHYASSAYPTACGIQKLKKKIICTNTFSNCIIIC